MSYLTAAIEQGLNKIYCSHTGFPIGLIDATEFEAFVELEDSLHGLDSEEDFLDHLHLALIPINNRPSPIFQNMTQTRYRLIAQMYPNHMVRYLLGKLFFERFKRGLLTVYEGKALFLQSIPVDVVFSQDTIDTLIRIDGILSVRKAFFSPEMQKRLDVIREGWTNLEDIEDFVEKLESSNMKYLSNYDAQADGRIQGNALAQAAVLSQIRVVDDEAFAAEFAAREAGRILNEARREARAKEGMQELTKRFNKVNAAGQVETRRGVSAIVSLATDAAGKFDKTLALGMISKLDFSKNKGIQRLKNEKNAARIAEKKTPSRKAKVVFDLSGIFSEVDI